jgi:hypothetical protein
MDKKHPLDGLAEEAKAKFEKTLKSYPKDIEKRRSQIIAKLNP